jgi:Terpene cyclase DEP1
MKLSTFEILVLALGASFAIGFCVIVVPPLLQSGDVVGAFAAGFVNPYASGYSLDTIICGLILLVWALHERSALGIRHGWVVLPLACLPGVATAFAVYLVMRTRQLAVRGGGN